MPLSDYSDREVVMEAVKRLGGKFPIRCWKCGGTGRHELLSDAFLTDRPLVVDCFHCDKKGWYLVHVYEEALNV